MYNASQNLVVYNKSRLIATTAPVGVLVHHETRYILESWATASFRRSPRMFCGPVGAYMVRLTQKPYFVQLSEFGSFKRLLVD